MPDKPVALITGAARRVGAAIAQLLHAKSYNVIVHYWQSQEAAEQLVATLNHERPNSACTLCANLLDDTTWSKLIQDALAFSGRIDVLINNASLFYKTPVGEVELEDWNNMMCTNLMAPFFLSQMAAPHLAKQQGNIINITDIHTKRPLKEHSVYCISKAGLHMMTSALAQALGPDVRVNAVAPGAVMWPEGDNALSESAKQYIIDKTALKRIGCGEDVALAVWSLLQQPFVTGQTLMVDGGRF